MPAVASGVATGAGEAPAGTLVHQRVALLVDADSLDSEANERHGAKVSYRRVFTLALRGRIAVRALAYMSEESEGSRIPFQDHLGSSGFETVRRVGPGRGAWNVRLALDAIALAEKVDTVVIASSSGELLPLLHHLQTQGVRVEVASFAPLDANPLSAHAVTFTPLGRSALYVL